MNELQSRPLRRHRWPAYPTRLDVLADATLLHRHMPAQWLSRKELTGAAALFLSTGSLSAPIACIPTPGIVAPPSMTCLSEAEAMQLIKDELTRGDISLDRENVELPVVLIADDAGDLRPFTIDLANQGRSIALEYLDEADYWTYGGWDENGPTAVADVATLITEQVAEQMPNLHFRTFYTASDASAFGTCPPEEARQALREQVRDFVDWLKGQGVI